MKLNFGLLGIALAQSGDDYSDERHDYSYDYNNVGNHHHYSGFGGDQSYSFNDFGAKVIPADILAIQLSCWNSNSLRDMNHDGKFYDTATDGSNAAHTGGSEYHHYNHQYGFENAYNTNANSQNPAPGSQSHALADFGDTIEAGREIDVSDDAHSVMAIDPKKWGYQSDNPDAKYHYGHHINEVDLSTNKNRPHSSQIDAATEDTFDGVIDDWRYSLRHSGCLYEAPDYFYGATTFNAQRFLTYGLTDGTTTITTDTNVHWVHVFNAHIHIDQSGTTGSCRSAGAHPITGQSCLNNDSIHQFAVVMANPTYEGLGFINFVATYHDGGTTVGQRFQSTYDKSALYQNTGYWHLSTNGPLVDSANSGTWGLTCDSVACDTTTWLETGAVQTTAPRGLAISSFPHNQLGKDFRFNIRTLHTMGDGYARAALRAANVNTAYSYFFYAISTITIEFPEYVGYVNDCWRHGVTCTKDNIHQVIVDQSAVQMTSTSPQNTNGDIAYGNYQLTAKLFGSTADTRCAHNSVFLAGAVNNCASWCHKGAGLTVNGHNTNTLRTLDNTDGADAFCGDTLTISGMHYTYDELHLRQFGTIQEIWVQLQYAYSHLTVAAVGSVTEEGFESPFPNVFFSAPQVESVSGSCSDATYGKCTGYTRKQNVPFAGSDIDANRWNEDVDDAGNHRGDAFWPDDLDKA